jgi:hypothetical protein
MTSAARHSTPQAASGRPRLRYGTRQRTSGGGGVWKRRASAGGSLRLTALACLRWLAPRGTEGATCVTTWRRVPDFPECASKQESSVRSTRTPLHTRWLVWAHRQVHAWRTTPSTKYACQCQYLDTAGNKGRFGHRTTGGARGATPPSRCARFCASSWRCQRRRISPVASPALALQRPGMHFAPLSPRQSLQAPSIRPQTRRTVPSATQRGLLHTRAQHDRGPNPSDHDPV